MPAPEKRQRRVAPKATTGVLTEGKYNRRSYSFSATSCGAVIACSCSGPAWRSVALTLQGALAAAASAIGTARMYVWMRHQWLPTA